MSLGRRVSVAILLLGLLAFASSVHVEAIRICGKHPPGRGRHPPGVGRHRNRTKCIDLNDATSPRPSVITISNTLLPGFAPGSAPSPSEENNTLVPFSSPSEAPLSSPSEVPLSFPSEAPFFSPSEVPLSSPSEAPVSSPSEAPLSAPSEAPVSTPSESAPLSSYLPESAIPSPESSPAVSRSPPPPREFPPGAQPPSYSRTVDPPPAQSLALPVVPPSLSLLFATFMVAILLSLFQ